jgi:thiamine-monophosphate kinase
MMPSKPYKISDLGEKKLIKRLLSRSQNPQVKSLFLDDLSIKSLSDDAALIDFRDKYLVASSDMLMESAHFPSEMSPYQIGQKVVTANVSDIAAMGAEAIGIIVSMGLSRNMFLDDFDQLVEGILDACKKYGMALIGGDTNESPEFTLCGTCLGMVEKKYVLMKGGARPGDIVAVTGSLGIAAAGFEVLFNQKSNINIADLDHSLKDLLLKHALEPEARLEEGILLGKSGVVTSATDITDGLLSEIGEIVDASAKGIGIVIQEDQLPIPEEVITVADITGKDPLKMAIAYGEDFELLLTVDPTYFDDLKSAVTLYEIGVVDGSGRITMIDKSGKTNIITPHGYEHLR